MPARVAIVVRPEYLLCILFTLLFFYFDKLSQKNDDCKLVEGGNPARIAAILLHFILFDRRLVRCNMPLVEGCVPK